MSAKFIDAPTLLCEYGIKPLVTKEELVRQIARTDLAAQFGGCKILFAGIWFSETVDDDQQLQEIVKALSKATADIMKSALQ